MKLNLSRSRFLNLFMLTTLSVVIIFNLFVSSSVPVEIPATAKANPVTEDYRIHAFPIPEKLSFAGEAVPMNKTYVRESYDRELLVNTYWQSSTLLLIKKSQRYFSIIEPILAAQGVPDDFKYLPMIESSLQERIVSPAGAVGLWQFLSAAAKENGLEVNKEVDERYHIEKATIAACKYLKDAYNKFGSWTLAAASYNAGARGIQNQIDKQKTNNYYELLLNEETARYVFRLIAIREIVSNPAEFGFIVEEENYYPIIATDTLIINGPVPDFADFAKEHGITYRELKDLNPWLRETFLTNASGKQYTIRLPKPGAFEVQP